MPRKQRFTIRKLSVGVVSVLLGFTFLTGHGNKHVSADTTSSETTNATASTPTVLTDQEVTLQNNDSTTPKDTTTTTDAANTATTADKEAASTTTSDNSTKPVTEQPAATTATSEDKVNPAVTSTTNTNQPANASQPAATTTTNTSSTTTQPRLRAASVATPTTTTTDNNQLTKQTGLSSADNAGSNIFQGKDGNWYKVVFEDGQNKVYKVADITASANTGLPESWVRENIVIAKEDLGNGKTHWTIVFFPNKGFSKDGNVKGLQNAGFAFILTKDYKIDGDISIVIDTDTSKNTVNSYSRDGDAYGNNPVETHVVQTFNPKTDIDEMGLVNSDTLKLANNKYGNQYIQGVYYITADQYNGRKDIDNIFFRGDSSDIGSDGKTYNGGGRGIYANNDIHVRSGEVQGGANGEYLIHDNILSEIDFNANGAFSSLDFGTLVSLKSWGSWGSLANDYSQHSTFTISFDTTHDDSYQAYLKENTANKYSNGGAQFSGLVAGFASHQNSRFWDGFLANGEQRVGKTDANGKWLPVTAEEVIDNFVNPDTAIAKFSPKYLNDAQIKAVKQKIAEATTQEAIDQAVADGYALDDAMMKLGQSVGVCGGPSERMVVNTRNSDKYVYDTQEDKDTYDQVAVEANKYLSRANGGYLDLNATQQLTQE